MNINSLLEGVNCLCGKNHRCDIKSVYIERNACVHLNELCNDKKNILVVADENTFNAAGEKVLDNLCNKSVEKVIFSGKKILIPDEDAIRTVKERLGKSEIIIGIGSGVIQDLCKYIAFSENLPYIIVATSPSMDGYASDGAAMILNGMKETVKAGLPTSILADTEVLKNAPLDMIKAGYGDIIGKYSALCDWKLSHVVNNEYFCDYIYNTTLEMIEKTLKLSDGILERDEKSVGALMEALVVVGVMMSFAGSSRPASGSEHHLSHFFEITGIVKDEPYFAHGIDVAYSTVVTSEIRENILKRAFVGKQFIPHRDKYVAQINNLYGKVGSGCIALQDRLGSYTTDRCSVYLKKEPQIREVLTDIPSSVELRAMLSKVGLDMSEFYAMYGKEKINDAVMYAKDLKDRYTVLWLNYDMFGGEINED